MRSWDCTSSLGLLDVSHMSAQRSGEHPGQAGVVVTGQTGQNGQPVQEAQVPTDDQHNLFPSPNSDLVFRSL